MGWSTDITHFSGVLDPSSNAPTPAKNIARFFGSIVQAATAWLPGDLLESAIHCRRRPKRKACLGRIRLVLVEHDENGQPIEDVRILWECPVCKDYGVIRNWEGSDWDLSDIERDDGFWESETLNVHLSDEEYLAVREALTDGRRLLALVIVAKAGATGPVVELTSSEMELLLKGVAEALKRAPLARRKPLQALVGKLTQALPADGSMH